MRVWYILIALAVIAGTLSPMATRVYAAPAAAEGKSLGLFGTVLAIVDLAIILNGGEVIATDDQTVFQVPGADGATIADIGLGDRLAILAAQDVDGGFLGIHILATPAEPVRNTHLVGVVTDAQNGVVTLTGDDGNPVTVTLPPGISARIGDFLTVVSARDDDSGELSASDVASVEDVLDRLADKIQSAVDMAEARLQDLLGNNGNQYLTALVGALGGASGDVRQDLEVAVEAANAGLRDAFDDAGVDGPYVKVRGFVTESTSTSVTIERPNGVEVTLQVIDATKIRGSIVVGAFVSAKHSLGNVAAKIEIEDDEFTLKGIVTSATTTALTLKGGRVFTLTDATEIDGELSPGVRVALELHPTGGDFVVNEVKVERTDEDEPSDEEGGDLKLAFKGAIIEVATTSITVDGLQVVLDAATEIEGTLELGARVEVEAILLDGVIVGSRVEVLAEDADVDEDESDIKFEGRVTDPSPTSIEVDGVLTILVRPETSIKGSLTPGANVEVRATTENGELVATSIKVTTPRRSEIEYEGEYATYVPFRLLVLKDGTEFVLNSHTETKGSISSSAVVKIEAIELADGTLLATKIEAQERERGGQGDERPGDSRDHDSADDEDEPDEDE